MSPNSYTHQRKEGEETGGVTVETIFPTISLDRTKIQWETLLPVLTPVERRGSLRFKRDDYFAPLGPGSVNGSKARQCLWLVNEAVKRGARGLVTGASVLSPQHSIVSTMARHFGIKSLHVVGATTPESMLKHESVAIAKEMGAEFDIINVAYNPMLQRRVAAILGKRLYDNLMFEGERWEELSYGITIDHRRAGPTPVDIEGFHRAGAVQVSNLPRDMEVLVIPSGSCNTLTSILYGLALYGKRFPNLQRIVAAGIGPRKVEWAGERLAIISQVMQFDAQEAIMSPVFHYYDLTGRWKYTDWVPYNYHGLELHPTYEGKVMTWFNDKRFEHYHNERTVFWIVGGLPSLKATQEAIA